MEGLTGFGCCLDNKCKLAERTCITKCNRIKKQGFCGKRDIGKCPVNFDNHYKYISYKWKEMDYIKLVKKNEEIE